MDTKSRETHEAEVQRLLKQVLDEEGEETICAAATSSDASSWEQLEKAFVAKGLPQAQVKQLMDPIKEAINRTAAPPPLNDLKSQQKEPKDSRQPSPKPLLAKPNPNYGSSCNHHKFPSLQLESGDKQPATILVADRANGGEHTKPPSPYSFYNIIS